MEYRMHKQAAGEWSIAKHLDGTSYAGTRTKEELKELEINLMNLLSLRLYPYSYIEKTLISKGYDLTDIRRAFEHITGISANSYLEGLLYKNIYEVPHTIPTYNLGWGVSKNKNYDYIFVMPYVYGYAIFGQKGEFQREIIKMFSSKELKTALTELKKLVKEVNSLNEVYEGKLKDKNPTPDLTMFSEPKYASLSEECKAIVDYLKTSNVSPKKAIEFIKESYYTGSISNTDYVALKTFFTKKAKEDDPLESTNIKKEISEVSANEYFENELEGEDESMNLMEGLEEIKKYLSEKQSQISNYTFDIYSFKYKTLKDIKTLQPNIESEDLKAIETLKSKGYIAIILAIKSKKTDETKYGLFLFTLVNGDLHTSGSFKGTDNKVYSFTEEGLDTYFEEDNDSSAS